MEKKTDHKTGRIGVKNWFKKIGLNPSEDDNPILLFHNMAL